MPATSLNLVSDEGTKADVNWLDFAKSSWKTLHKDYQNMTHIMSETVYMYKGFLSTWYFPVEDKYSWESRLVRSNAELWEKP